MGVVPLAALTLLTGLSLEAIADDAPAAAPSAAPEQLPAPVARPKAPRFKAPRYPLEPNKKAAEAVHPETFVEAPTSPPVSAAEAAIFPRLDKEGWGSSLQLTWFTPNESADHNLTTATQAARHVHGDYSSPLSVMAQFSTRPPGLPVSLVARASGTFGSGNATGDFANASYSATEMRAQAGLRIHPLSRASRHDLKLGADAGIWIGNELTLNSTQSALDVDSRRALVIIPKVSYQYSPNPNWAVECAASEALPLSTSGAGDTRSTNLRRFEGELSGLRYVAEGSAFGLGFTYARQTAVWSQTVPATLTDSEDLSELRVSLFWRLDF